ARVRGSRSSWANDGPTAFSHRAPGPATAARWIPASLRGEVGHAATLALGPDLLLRDQRPHGKPHGLHVGSQRLGDLLTPLPGILLDVGEQTVGHLLDLSGRAPEATATAAARAHADDLDLAPGFPTERSAGRTADTQAVNHFLESRLPDERGELIRE